MSGGDMQKIDMIASGYEWNCPSCCILNKEIECNAYVQCENCGEQCQVDEVHHAYGKEYSINFKESENVSD
jgi:hypothetical protein